jgi:uncharacterized membrane protein YdbT with pleckstrin-like domain
MIIRHSKKTLIFDGIIGTAVFIFMYFLFVKYFTGQFGVYIIGFAVTLLVCFFPLLKEWLKYKFDYIEIDEQNFKIVHFFNKTVVQANKFADYKILSGIFEKIFKLYNLEIYTLGGEIYGFNRIDKELNFENIMEEFTQPANNKEVK